MTESSPQNCSTVAVAVNTLLVSLTLRFIAACQQEPPQQQAQAELAHSQQQDQSEEHQTGQLAAEAIKSHKEVQAARQETLASDRGLQFDRSRDPLGGPNPAAETCWQ